MRFVCNKAFMGHMLLSVTADCKEYSLSLNLFYAICFRLIVIYLILLDASSGSFMPSHPHKVLVLHTRHVLPRIGVFR